MLTFSDRVARRKTTVRCLLALGHLAVFCLCVPPHALAQEVRATCELLGALAIVENSPEQSS